MLENLFRRGKPTEKELQRGLSGITPASEETFRKVADEKLDRLAGKAYRLGEHLSQHPRDQRAQHALIRVVNTANRIAEVNSIERSSGDPFTSR